MPRPDYPLRFQPIYQERLWGGDHHRRLLGAEVPAGGAIGESWEIADRPQAETKIRNGELAGRTLREVTAEHPEALLGPGARPDDRFPLLVKFIGSRDRLSLQVHPDDAYAKRHHPGELGKTEMWYILDAEPGAELMIGFRTPQTREAVSEAIAAGRFEDMVRRVPVKPGEAFFLPAGRVHAIGAGIMLAEIQENSDVTYRVYDYNRRDAQGRPRELHVDRALDVMHYDDVGDGRLEGDLRQCRDHEISILARDPHFFTNYECYHHPADGQTLPGFQILVVTEGSGRLVWEGGAAPTRRGDVWLLPAALGGHRLEPDAEGLGLLRSWRPDPERRD